MPRSYFYTVSLLVFVGACSQGVDFTTANRMVRSGPGAEPSDSTVETELPSGLVPASAPDNIAGANLAMECSVADVNRGDQLSTLLCQWKGGSLSEAPFVKDVSQKDSASTTFPFSSTKSGNNYFVSIKNVPLSKFSEEATLVVDYTLGLAVGSATVSLKPLEPAAIAADAIISIPPLPAPVPAPAPAPIGSGGASLPGDPPNCSTMTPFNLADAAYRGQISSWGGYGAFCSTFNSTADATNKVIEDAIAKGKVCRVDANDTYRNNCDMQIRAACR